MYHKVKQTKTNLQKYFQPNLYIQTCQEPKRSAKGSNFKEDDMALAL